MARPTANELWRAARTPRQLGLALLALVLIAAFLLLGRWQWQRTQDVLASERAATAAPIAVDGLNPVGQAITNETVGRPVTAAGSYEPGLQRIVVQRSLGEQPGVWVVTPLRLADGSLVPVLRGWLPSADAPGITPPSGAMRITGVLQADESFYKDAAAASGGEVSAISQRSLDLGPSARAGFITLMSQVPAASPAPTPVPVDVRAADVAFPLQNFFYTFQWWALSIVVIGVYARWLWLDAQDAGETQALAGPSGESTPRSGLD
jgi:cytochrome oxidase assembly protein ShyY1